MLVVGLILIGIASRFLVHIPNFTPLLAVALFAGALLPRKWAVIVPVALYALVDLMVGWHPTIAFTWGSMALIAVIGQKHLQNRSWKRVAGTSLVSALLFYVITNFGAWIALSVYPKNLAGLVECYVAAIPFFRNTLASSVLYSFVLFGAYDIVAGRVKDSRLAFVLNKK